MSEVKKEETTEEVSLEEKLESLKTTIIMSMVLGIMAISVVILVAFTKVLNVYEYPTEPVPTEALADSETERHPWNPMRQLDEYHQTNPFTTCWEVFDYYGNVSSICSHRLYNIVCFVHGESIWCMEAYGEGNFYD